MVKDFGDYWDDLADEKGANTRANIVLSLIKKHKPSTKSVLELGIGSGNVLKNFPKKYSLHGLDVEAKYVALARKKMPRANLIASSMHNFKFDKKFDVIFSIFDSINFLDNFNQWKQTFKTVHNHLEDGGIFIFDMYAPMMLEKAKTWSIFSKEKFGFMWDKAIVKGNKLTWNFHIFEKIKNNTYELNEYKFSEKIFDVEKVEFELKKHFKIVEKRDAADLSGDLKKPSKNTYRLIYVVRKK